MICTKRLFVGLLALLAVSMTNPISSPAWADQTDPRLNPLFEVLLNAPLNSPDAFIAQQKIWEIWLEGPSASANVLMRQGITQMQEGAVYDAIISFTALIQLEPDYAEAWNKRATVNYMAGRFSDALADIKQTIDLEPRHFAAQSGRGMVFDAMHDPEAALTAFEKALRINPHMPQIMERIDQLKSELEGSRT